MIEGPVTFGTAPFPPLDTSGLCVMVNCARFDCPCGQAQFVVIGTAVLPDAGRRRRAYLPSPSAQLSAYRCGRKDRRPFNVLSARRRSIDGDRPACIGPRRVAARWSFYSLGVILYHVHRPFIFKSALSRIYCQFAVFVPLPPRR